MSYNEALEAAGAEVHEFEQFGDYQGTWLAYVTYKGEKGFCRGYYGSCSGCDSFQREFDWSDADACDEHRYERPTECKACDEASYNYTVRLAEFGRGYLEGNLMSLEEVLEHYKIEPDEDGYAWNRDEHTKIQEWAKRVAK